MKNLLFAMLLLIEVAFGVEARAQTDKPITQHELKNEVIEMPEIGVKIVWDAANEKLFILGQNKAEKTKLSLDGVRSKTKHGKGVRILYETTFGAAMPLYEQVKPKYSDDEFEDISAEDLEKSYVGDVISDVVVTLAAWKNKDESYGWVIADISVYVGEIWLEVYTLDSNGETVLLSKLWRRE